MLRRMPADLRRERIGMMFINIDPSRGCTMRGAGSRLVDGGHVTGGNAGNLTFEWSGRLCSPDASPYSGTKEFPVVAPASAQYRVVVLLMRRADPPTTDRQNRWRELRKSPLDPYDGGGGPPPWYASIKFSVATACADAMLCRLAAANGASPRRLTKECISPFQMKYASETQIYQSIDIIYRSIYMPAASIHKASS
jgi:hypothetical protein